MTSRLITTALCKDEGRRSTRLVGPKSEDDRTRGVSRPSHAARAMASRIVAVSDCGSERMKANDPGRGDANDEDGNLARDPVEARSSMDLTSRCYAGGSRKVRPNYPARGFFRNEVGDGASHRSEAMRKRIIRENRNARDSGRSARVAGVAMCNASLYELTSYGRRPELPGLTGRASTRPVKFGIVVRGAAPTVSWYG